MALLDDGLLPKDGAVCLVCKTSCGCYPSCRPEADCPFSLSSHMYDIGVCQDCYGDKALSSYRAELKRRREWRQLDDLGV